MNLIDQFRKRREAEAKRRIPVYSLTEVSIAGIKEFRKKYKIYAGYSGKTSFNDGVTYCPYIPPTISSENFFYEYYNYDE